MRGGVGRPAGRADFGRVSLACRMVKGKTQNEMKKESLKLSFLLVLSDSDPVAGIVAPCGRRSAVPVIIQRR